eukprot:6375116-Pyramimonas_sp.AAC.1
MEMRGLAYESDECVEELASLEWVTDCMDKSTSEELQQAIVSAKTHKRNQEEFTRDLVAYKARPARSTRSGFRLPP